MVQRIQVLMTDTSEISTSIGQKGLRRMSAGPSREECTLPNSVSAGLKSTRLTHLQVTQPILTTTGVSTNLHTPGAVLVDGLEISSLLKATSVTEVITTSVQTVRTSHVGVLQLQLELAQECRSRLLTSPHLQLQQLQCTLTYYTTELTTSKTDLSL